jgi:putative hydrolase of the HAD superfamily
MLEFCGPPLDHQHLLFDADDTLWENNIHFERAFDAFVAHLDHEALSVAEIREMLDEVERATLISHGYGARGFAHTLRETFRHITGSHDEAQLATVEALGLRILDLEIELIADVRRTLDALRPHHDLFLVTKGQLEEQRRKIERSGIADLFDATIVTEEKRVDTYRETVAALDLEPERTWMIGNSPKSDIMPALEAGLNAIFIPHAMTWHMEHIEIAHNPAWPGRLVEVARFTELTSLFRHQDGSHNAREARFAT